MLNLLFGMFFIFFLVSCSKSEYQPQEIKRLVLMKNSEHQVVQSIESVAYELGYSDRIEMPHLTKDDNKKYFIILKNGKSFINISNLYSERCIDISIYS